MTWTHSPLMKNWIVTNPISKWSESTINCFMYSSFEEIITRPPMNQESPKAPCFTSDCVSIKNFASFTISCGRNHFIYFMSLAKSGILFGFLNKDFLSAGKSFKFGNKIANLYLIDPELSCLLALLNDLFLDSEIIIHYIFSLFPS